ncbi:MAG TPA: hypothetical protein VGE28_05600 [Pseudomonas sp.]
MTYALQADALVNAILALMHGQVEDAHCYRSLMDNLYAFRTGAINRQGKWDSRKIRQRCHWTTAAVRAREQGGGVETEHVVPMAAIVRILLSRPTYDVEWVNEVVGRYCLYCMVTPQEHRILNRKYQRKMPDEFWDASSALHMDAWARYKLSGIAL